MSIVRIRDSLESLERALGKLEVAINTPRERELVVEGTIQRFEFVIELLWKTLKRALEYEGVRTKTPRESLKAAYGAGWIHDEDAWLALLDLRNSTSHLYLHEELLDDHYNQIVRQFSVMKAAVHMLRGRYPRAD